MPKRNAVRTVTAKRAASLGGDIDLGKILKFLGEAFGLIQECKNKHGFAKICELLKELARQLNGQQWGDFKVDKFVVDCDKTKIAACTQNKITFNVTLWFDLPGPSNLTLGPFTFVIDFADFDKFANEIKAKNILKKAFK